MRLMQDKELLLSIWDTYTQMDVIKVVFDQYFQIKLEIGKSDALLLKAGKEVAIPMYDFYSSPIPYDMMQKCKDMAKMLNETAEKLEKAL